MEEIKVDITKVWHKGKEMPENGSHILMQVHYHDKEIGDVVYLADRTAVAQGEEDWKAFLDTCHVLQWCYVKDIFYDKTEED